MSGQHLEHDWFSKPLPDNVHLGAKSWLYSSYALAHYRSLSLCGLRVGPHSGLYHGTFFDLGPDAEIEIGEYCSVVGAIFSTNGRVSIGNYGFIAHEVVLGDSDWAAPYCERQSGQQMSPRSLRSHIAIGANVWIGAQAIIVGSVRIGEGAIIGAGTVVKHDVPPYTICVGNPMQIVRAISATESNPPD